MDNTVDNKTLAMGIQSLVHHGAFLERIDADKPFLPGSVVMVPKGVWAVLTAGDKATTVLDDGLHELDLMLFNRRPSGIMYLVHKESHEAVWADPGGQNPLTVILRCKNPQLLVQTAALDREIDGDNELWSLVFSFVSEAVHAQIPPSEARKNLESSLEGMGLELVALTQGPREKATVQIRKNPPSADAPHERVRGFLELTHVMASSTMDAVGKGELSLVARLQAATTQEKANQGDFLFDQTMRFDSPQGWLQADMWLSLPPGTLTFEGLEKGWVAVLELLAEERDPGTTDALGAVTTPLLLQPGSFELGPTQGGKGDHFIRVKGHFSLSSSD